jgi:hypothetical protein
MTTLQIKLEKQPRPLTSCPDTFQVALRDLAARHSKMPEQVYGWWKEYAATCLMYGQSALLGEFEAWYKGLLAS